VRDFWLQEYEGDPARFRAEAIASTQNKVGAFLAHPLPRRILTQSRSSFDLRTLMDEGGILFVNLAKREIDEDGTALLGALLVANTGTATLGWAELAEEAQRHRVAPVGAGRDRVGRTEDSGSL